MEQNLRILIVDDNADIHKDFDIALSNRISSAEQDLALLEADLLDGDGGGPEGKKADPRPPYEIHHAFQGEEAVEIVEKAEKAGTPFALIFMDVRMPPGIDGIETISRIWKNYPHIEVVICTAFSDIAWEDIPGQLGNTERLLFLKKPYDLIEARQMALSLTRKWNLTARTNMYTNRMEELVQERTVKLEEEIRQRKESERQMRRSRDEAEKARHEAEKAYRVKSDFLSNISHEIRTPLNGIIGFTDVLLEDSPTESQKENLEIVQNCSTVLLTLVNDILDLSKIEAGQFALEAIDFDVEEVIKSVIELVRSRLKNKPIEIKTCIDEGVCTAVSGDPTRLKQVLTNLLDNAAKFTKEGEIRIGLGAIDEDDESIHLRFTVSDTGIGINPEKAYKLFQAFTQQDSSTTRKYGGTGLGLAICRKIIELMGGGIGINEHKTDGAEFIFHIPFMKAGREEDPGVY